MKRKVFSLILSIFLTTLPFVFIGCTKNTPYIEVVGIKTEYKIGEPINLSSAKIHYYEDRNSKTYSQISITNNMISGFSTDNPGTFVMIITYNNLSKKINYTVTNTPYIEEPKQLTATDIESLLPEVVLNMCSYFEIKETNSFPYVQESYKVTTQYTQYKLEEEDFYSWTFKEGSTWWHYKVSRDFNWNLQYHKYITTVRNNNLKIHTYQQLFENYEFIEGTKTNNNYEIVFNSLIMTNGQIIVTINNNLIQTIKSYSSSGNNKEYMGSTSFSYYTESTTNIPSIPNFNWSYKGTYSF